MDIERISADQLTREAWTVHLLEDRVQGRLRARVIYYLRQTRPDKRHKWTMASYWTQSGHGNDTGRLPSPPRIPDDEILDALLKRMVVEWPAEGVR